MNSWALLVSFSRVYVRRLCSAPEITFQTHLERKIGTGRSCKYGIIYGAGFWRIRHGPDSVRLVQLK